MVFTHKGIPDLYTSKHLYPLSHRALEVWIKKLKDDPQPIHKCEIFTSDQLGYILNCYEVKEPIDAQDLAYLSLKR